MQMIKKLGFLINVEKTQLEPTTKQKVLKFCVDSVKMEVSLTNDKKDEIVNTMKPQNTGHLRVLKRFARY